MRLLQASVRRDLEWLLNTRRTPEAADEEYPEVAKSVYNYGLPDLNALNWESSRDRTRLARAVQEALDIFEPRLRGIQVVPLEPVAGAPHVMRFQIEGLLEMDPAPGAHLLRHDAAAFERRVSGEGGFECGMICCSTTSAS